MLQQDAPTILDGMVVKKRAVLYARVSKDDRNNDARNLEGQIDLCREYARRQKYAIVDEIQEDERGASGASFDLDGINHFLDLAESGKFDVLIVREVDRLARNRTKQEVIKEQLKQHNIRVEYVLQKFTNDPYGRFSENMYADFAELERELITLRMVRGRRNKVRAGYVLVSKKRAPYGYTVIETKKGNLLAVDESTAGFVRLIFDWYTNDLLTLNKIAKKLQKMQAPLPTGGIKKNTIGWLGSTVGKILKSETYVGVWYYGKYNSRKRKKNPKDKWIAVPVPNIVPPAQFEAAQERMKLNKANAKRNRKHNYLLSGMCTCGHCGLKLSGFSAGRKQGPLYYVCNSKTNRQVRPRNCSLPYIRADKLENSVWKWVVSKIMDEEELENGLRDYLKEQKKDKQPLYNRLETIEKILADNRSQLHRLLDLYLSGEFAKEILTDRKNRIEKTITELEKERDLLISQIENEGITEEQIQEILEFTAAIREELKDILVTDDFPYKRKILELLRVKVVVNSRNEAILQCNMGKTGVRIDTQTTSENLLLLNVPLLFPDRLQNFLQIFSREKPR